MSCSRAMRPSVLASGLLGVGLLLGCAPPDHETRSRAELDVGSWTALLDRTADFVVADQHDCAQMAKDLSGLLGQQATLIKVANAALADGIKLPDDAQQRIVADVQRMLPGIDACGTLPEVQKAFKLAKPDEG
jgi:hypothetical protein